MRILILACAAMAMSGTARAEELTVIQGAGVDQWRTEGPVQCTNPCPPDATRSWHLLTQSYGGTVSLLKDLTKHECETLEAKLSWSCSAEQCTRMLTPDLIKSAECFQ